MPNTWVTYADDNTFFEASIILFRSLHKVGTVHDCIIMTPVNFKYTGNLSLYSLKTKNVILKAIPPLDQQHSNHSEKRYSACLNKLYVWLLTDYEKVCWLDSDMIVMKNIDHLFDLEIEDGHMLAAPGCLCNVFNNPKFITAQLKCPYVCNNNIYINSGLFIIKPNPNIYDLLLQEDYNRPLSDQDVFNDFFSSKINMLPPTYNYMSQLDLIHPEVNSHDVHIFHFTYDKPWETVGRTSHEKYYKHWRELLKDLNKSHIHI